MTTPRRRVALGTVDATDQTLHVNLPELVVTRLLIQASSGGGKSFLLRRLLEQTHGQTQQIIIDVEGEFASLREKFDYVYAAKDGGDTTVDPRGAALLAERLLELKVSAILDIYELAHHQRIIFVQRFIDALINAPKHLWHPALVVVDEAHIFCPQSDKGSTESADSIMALCTRGRKRGFCAILATQRLAKLHKDAAAECLNRLIGRTSLDTDVKRAGDELGFDKQRRQELRKLHPGEFFAFGPAISREVLKMKGGPIQTRHPKAGGRIRFTAPRPTKKIRSLLPKLADLPAEEAQRVTTVRELRRELDAAEHRIAGLEKSTAPKTVAVITKPQMTRLRALSSSVARAVSTLATVTSRLQSASAVLALQAPPQPTAATGPAVPVDIASLSASMRLLAAIKAYPGADVKRIGMVARVSSRVSTFRVNIVTLRKKGWIRGDYREGLYLTPDGEKAAKDLPTPPSGPAAIAHWRATITGSVNRELFEVILKAGARGISADDIERATGINTHISTFRVGINHLKHRNIISGDRECYLIAKELL